ncbi:MAG TPA: hypothetical protein VGI45_31220 [Terracidiphilus sp.]
MHILFVVIIAVFGFAAIVIPAIFFRSARDKAPNGAESWPTTEGTVRGTGMAAVSRHDQLPWFDFSYVVDGEHYSGTFMLAADRDRANTLLREMDEKKFTLRYDPTQPSRFYVVDNAIEGCEVKFRSGAPLTP